MEISVGILFAPLIRFRLHGKFISSQFQDDCSGEYTVSEKNGKLFLQSGNSLQAVTLPLTFSPREEASATFELTDVTIGIQFHWERTENQFFKGSLEIIQEENYLTAINRLNIEDYLLSVISSEMKATSSPEFLKAHAVISRSWLLAQQEKSAQLRQNRTNYCSTLQNEKEYIRWYDREDHAHFDVCADDHCQRYQGIQKASTPAVRQAIEATCGEVLCYQHHICDARFSKCCGGLSEKFENVWEAVPHPYLTPVYDAAHPLTMPSPTDENTAAAWIGSSPDVFCNTTDPEILLQVLHDYDRETHDFFRWEVYYTQAEISALLRKKLGIDPGEITDLIPIERGESGRIIRLKVCGTRDSRVIGKELVIRKAFSPTHLYSSAFIVEKEIKNGQIQGFRLKGAGWGHGVGLCQIGAAVMGARGYTYREILAHYFPGTTIEKKY